MMPPLPILQGPTSTLGSGGDEVWLETPQGFVVDNMVIPALANEQSFGCKPDGATTRLVLLARTKGCRQTTTRRHLDGGNR